MKDANLGAGRDAMAPLLDAVQKQCQEYSRHLKFNVGDEQTRVAVCLYGSIIEFGESLCTLAKLQRWIGFGPTLRAMLEAFVDLRNVLHKKSYIRSMEAAFWDSREKIFLEALKGKNEFLNLLGERDEAKPALAECRDRLKELRKQGFEKLNVFERFERAGMASEYRSIYGFLCNEAHNDLSTLLRRHIRIQDGRPSITFFRDLRQHERVAEIFQAVEVPMFATEAIFSHCEGALPDGFGQWREKVIADFRALIPDPLIEKET